MIKIEPKNKAQANFIALMKAKVVTVATGSAGTGKSFLAAATAAQMLSGKEVKKIIITRPNVAISTSLGFFPGSLEEKMAPWVVPIMSNLEAFLGKGMLETQLRNGNIEVVPFETIRGRSFDNCFVILDEAQNTTIDEMKAFVTRIGEYTTCVITGDLTQTDLGSYNGLWHLLRLVEGHDQLRKYVGRIQFTSDDIVRSGICQLFVEAFEADKAAKNSSDPLQV